MYCLISLLSIITAKLKYLAKITFQSKLVQKLWSSFFLSLFLVLIFEFSSYFFFGLWSLNLFFYFLFKWLISKALKKQVKIKMFWKLQQSKKWLHKNAKCIWNIINYITTFSGLFDLNQKMKVKVEVKKKIQDSILNDFLTFFWTSSFFINFFISTWTLRLLNDHHKQL